MIFVSLGTQDKSFKRLLMAIEKQINNGNINDEVIVQAGYTKYESDKMKVLDLVSMEDFEKYISSCDLLITHGGVGSILDGLKHNKKIIAAPRLKEYGEHTNDHQLQIINSFYEKGYILKLDDFDKFDKVLENLESFKPKKFVFNNKNFVMKIKEYIDNN